MYHRSSPSRPAAPESRPAALLFDRDDTLIRDTGYIADPDLVEPLPGARAQLRRVRGAGVRTGIVSNQSGVASGRISLAQLAAVNARVEALLGPFDTWQICAHGRADGCRCRKPEPGLILGAAAELGVAPSRCVVIGDIGSDIEAALAAGARAVLVPTPRTRATETEHARRVAAVARDLTRAITLALDAPGMGKE
ncbi:D-glycero-alpha-D-manno-heptose-1,7-bisphosphate 7-phosphatase [Nocardia cyriacigeorgica]